MSCPLPSYPEDDQRCYLQPPRTGLYQSNDQGETWQKVESLTSTDHQHALDPSGTITPYRGDIEVFDIVFDSGEPVHAFCRHRTRHPLTVPTMDGTT
jgi:hypothetical protein